MTGGGSEGGSEGHPLGPFSEFSRPAPAEPDQAAEDQVQPEPPEPPEPRADPDARRAPPRTSRSQPTGTFDETGLQVLGARMRSLGRRHRRRHRKARWVLGMLAVVLVLAVGGMAGYAWYLNHEIHRIDVRGLTDVPSTGADANTQNILLVGNTSRCALKVQSTSFGLCSEGVNGVNSDVIMVLHVNPANHSLAILSIPRDFFVPDARSTGPGKIDAALAEGPSQLVTAVEEDFGIPIQHYVELNFDSFAGVVDALGGVKMYFPEPAYDQETGLNITTPGCVNLDGFQALALVRARHVRYKPAGVTATNPAYWPQDPESDLSRIRRDHEFLRCSERQWRPRGWATR